MEPDDDQGVGCRGFVVVVHGSDDDRQTGKGIAAAPEAGNGIVGARRHWVGPFGHGASPFFAAARPTISGFSLPYFMAALVTPQNR
ncbi:MAG: hypothetical protein JNK06_18790 [Candidatus Accumulibacter phosphatis]|jgi:hypothetical protein|uniref:hypothetical protein n=1 Tax=Candidatus Accumulibacter phosphatis TaxID=327160 RepID=UPI001A54B0BB|nr:hypothetical protein [Candidatus Accumulibacter phosphatis]